MSCRTGQMHIRILNFYGDSQKPLTHVRGSFICVCIGLKWYEYTSKRVSNARHYTNELLCDNKEYSLSSCAALYALVNTKTCGIHSTLRTFHAENAPLSQD